MKLEEMINTIICADCLDIMKDIPDRSIDLVLTDPPYGVTACKWDTVIPFEPMWEQLKRIIKKNGAIVLFGSQPFTSALVMSNPKMFKYDWVWDKDKPSGVFLAKKQPLRTYENISVFYSKQPTYNPQMTNADPSRIRPLSQGNILGCTNNITNSKNCKTDKNYDQKKRYPKNILKYSNPVNKAIHPTQKPIKLMEYLIRTYTNEGEIVLDFALGSGTTAVACKVLKRRFIGIEKELKYVDIANKRLAEYDNQLF